ncbi:Dihydrolipoyl dehydrogenase [Clostridium liquoris]|uniref:Dihydrolipoyl dehydrogenase n=1 Tax=Clostridium liquoris TaxID=1289519 RepID=A0A2T0B0Z0_9CLOT|nr:dihydrolipoyl dehydrogenase [Clostridium liquoris]PRR77269.1 Dihydrolipoyl dehydrogenase [Clostridium liquoris]
MIIEVKLEKLSPGSKEGKVGKIHKTVGQLVKAGDVLLEVEGRKGNIPVKSNIEGKICSLDVEEGSRVKLGDVLFKIDVEKNNEEHKGCNESAMENIQEKCCCKEKDVVEGDIAILGGGPGGYVAAIQAAKLGAKVVLIEKDKVGGTCLNRGCIPTKALVRSAEVYNNIKEAESFGISIENPSVDMTKVIERKNKIVDNLVGGIEYLLNKNNIKFIKGKGKLVDNNTITIDDKTLVKAKNIIIATGSKTCCLPIKGANFKNVITSDEALDLKELPKKIVIIGGGVIGMEFAFIYANMGVEVYVVEYFDNVLTMLDQDVIDEITNISKDKGIKLYTGCKVEEILAAEEDECIVKFNKNGEYKYVSCDKVLMSVGRQPYFENIGIENLNIELNERGKGIKVNDKMETSIPNIYAIGDVTNKMQLAHVASHQGIVAVKNILGTAEEMDYNSVPSVIFTEPEIAAVGITEKIAKEEGMDIVVGKFPFAANGKAMTYGETRGFIKIIKESSSGKIIGCSIIGPHASDLIAEVTLAVKNGLTAEQIIETIHAHPTTSEVIHEAALATEGGAIHFAE